MSFYLKYELSRLLHSDEAKTFQAVEKSTRRNVLLHLVDKSASPALVQKIQRLDAKRNGQVVEVGEFAGSYYVVTDAIDHFEGLGQWLDLHVLGAALTPAPGGSAAARPSAPPRPAPHPEKELFAEPARPEAKPVTSPTVVDPTRSGLSQLAPRSSASRSIKEPEEAGEFTKMFGGGARPAPAAPTPPQSRPPERPEPSDEAGEFTRLFGDAQPKVAPASTPPATPRPPATPPPAASPGAFTEFFGAAEKPAYAPPPPAPPAPSAKAGRESEGSGEFTRLFGGAAEKPAPAPLRATPQPQPRAEAKKEGSGEFTQLFGGGERTPSAPPSPQAGPQKEGSGEFTRLFGGGAPNPTGAVPDDWEIVGESEPAPRLAPKTPAPKGQVEKSSGEFTRLFGPSGDGRSAPKTPKPAPNPLSSPIEEPLGQFGEGPGEFTQMFGPSGSASSRGGGGAKRPPVSSFGEGLVGEISGDDALAPDKGPKVSKGSKPFRAPGEFTRMFGPSDPSQAPPEEFIPAPHKAGGEAYASGLFKNPHAEAPRKPAATTPSGAQQPPTSPGDYTLAFERPKGAAPAPVPQPAPPMAATTPAAAPSSGPSKGMLIALIVAVLVAGLSLGAAVYLFFSGAPDASGDAPPAVEQPAEKRGAGE